MLENNSKSKLLKYGITFAVAAVIAVIIMWAKGLFTATAKADVYRILCDAFFVPGIMYVLLGLLFFVAGAGSFDGFNYALKMAFLRFTFSKNKKRVTYAEYKESKDEKRKDGFSILFLFLIGLIFVVVSIIMLILYYRVK